MTLKVAHTTPRILGDLDKISSQSLEAMQQEGSIMVFYLHFSTCCRVWPNSIEQLHYLESPREGYGINYGKGVVSLIQVCKCRIISTGISAGVYWTL